MNGDSVRNLHVTHVIAGLAMEHGGPSYSVPRLVRALGRLDVDAELLSVDTGAAIPDGLPLRTRLFPQSFASVPLLRNFRFSMGLRRELLTKRRRPTVIHGHGLWLKPNLDVAAAARRRGVPLVISPRGMLAPEALRFSWLRKRVVWWFGQRAALGRAACLHATSLAERDAIRAFGVGAPIAVIPNGIDVPAARLGDHVERKTVLVLGRIHPKKGLANLVEAWALVGPQRPDWRLRIAGPDEDGHAGQLVDLAARLGAARVTIEGAIYNDAKKAAFGEAGVLVMPSTNENFGLSAAEALAAGVPVIASRGTPWSGLETERAGWWVDASPASLAAALVDATGRPAAELAAMGLRGRAWMERDFGWDRVAAEMIAVYRWLLDGGQVPESVHLP